MLYNVIDTIFVVYMWMLVIRVISSWFPEHQGNPILVFICHYTDPYLQFFRRVIPSIGMLDISPIAAFISLQIMEYVVKGILFR